jgi:asparagine synthase (glutamine-hydrolysing)
MCGIGGAIRHPDKLDLLVPLILKDQIPRGPDYSSSVEFTAQNLKISLAHNRLAILDLSDRSNQPFVDLATGACVVFNGEIYNYVELRQELAEMGVRFTTQSDTEVLLKAFLTWGTKCFEKFIGMFAFAVWDPRTGKMTLVRDRYGVKPCYYVDQNGYFSFASNTTALAQFFSLNMNLDYLARGPIYNLYEDSDGSSPFEGINSLPPGHYLEMKDGRTETFRYYDFEAGVQEEADILAELSDEQILLRLEERLRSSVHLRLRADVPTTISLSGGLDSTLLAYLMSEESNRPTEAFTFGAMKDPRSEGHIAREAAENLGLKLHFVEVGNLVECFEKTLSAQGAPFAHPSVMAQNRVFEEIHKHGYRVSIGGQGADEVFLGYRKFQFFNAQEQLRHRQWWSLIKSAYGLARMLSAEMGAPHILAQYFKRYMRRTPLGAPFRETEVRNFNIGFSGYSGMRARQFADVGFGSLATLLRYEDRNSMGHSVESRMPFLDVRVMQMGLAIPTRLKIRNGYGKWILRKMAENRIPESIVRNRVKLAFSLDANEWLRDGLGDHLMSGIQPKLRAMSDILSADAAALLAAKETYLNPRYFPLMVTAFWLAKRQ